MSLTLPEVKASFIVDGQGNKKQVVLDIEQYHELLETLEDYHDIAVAALAVKENEQAVSIEELEKEILQKKRTKS